MIEVSSDILFYCVIGLGLLVAILFIWIGTLSSRLKKFTTGKDGKNLEKIMLDIIEASALLHEEQENAQKQRAVIEQKLQQSIRGVGVIRFNPFKDSGGNQSFACALLNESGDGAVISTLFSRERMSIFAKPITNFSSEHTLSEEETQAIEKAHSDLDK